MIILLIAKGLKGLKEETTPGYLSRVLPKVRTKIGRSSAV